ncbi:undecaprenyl diphosphate synthase [Halodesulfurarchaeum formicicum]|uniref:Tritrans,polycis-undecaprenyl-diphosphate synthase (geranylgeranyl-diphosphate specific) n=1 Tax=Halodesulfurarchaeum formicicum TaxID=1873524 RepID=A0A1D8S2L8_9EURY|nr:polyprenyl diphosphate synthase [Halodesulfurarchaeum formicicum]AOW79607.1 undecaprenyl diphosphate synthase [Halodesulfurarchaeum formicicum]APE94858.1 undecaprenyl diphosphate synthase [Halodesulfurarchaeum formicicum]
MRDWIARGVRAVYERVLRREISGVPTHVAIIQDGNRRYAREQGAEAKRGHEAGAETTEQVLEWCADLGIEELTIYAFSTENFDRPAAEREHLFDLLTEKLYEFADSDRIHEEGVRIRALGQTHRVPERVQDAIAYARQQTAAYDNLTLNVAIAYGGRAALLDVAQDVADGVATGDLEPEDVDVEAIESRLYDGELRDVDLIVRTGGDERTSNFLPWHANGNEAAAFFCTPYWPEFSKVDFLRAIRTYEAREASWRQTRTQRALALVRALGEGRGRRVLDRLGESLPDGTEPIEEAESSAD